MRRWCESSKVFTYLLTYLLTYTFTYLLICLPVYFCKENEDHLTKLSIEVKERDNSVSLVRMETGHQKEELNSLHDKYNLLLSQNGMCQLKHD